jgi:hypothetical protein
MRLRTHAATKPRRLRERPRRIMPSPLRAYIREVGGRGLVGEVRHRRVRVRAGAVRRLGILGRGRCRVVVAVGDIIIARIHVLYQDGDVGGRGDVLRTRALGRQRLVAYVLSLLRRTRVGSHVDWGARAQSWQTRRGEGGVNSKHLRKRTVATRAGELQVEH